MTLTIQRINTFTTTLGTGNTIQKKFHFNKNLLQTSYFHPFTITNLTELKTYKSQSKSHRLGKIIHDLEVLGKNLAQEFQEEFIDPIEYIIQLYYGDLLSIENIFQRVNGKGISYKDATGLSKLLTLTFKFILRDASENKTTKVYKARDAEKSIQRTLERKAQRTAEFLRWFIKNSNPDLKNFNRHFMESLEYKYQKFLYIIETVFRISKEHFGELKNLNMGNQSLADRFNDRFKEYNIDLHIGHKDIQRAFEKLISKK